MMLKKLLAGVHPRSSQDVVGSDSVLQRSEYADEATIIYAARSRHIY